MVVCGRRHCCQVEMVDQSVAIAVVCCQVVCLVVCRRRLASESELESEFRQVVSEVEGLKCPR